MLWKCLTAFTNAQVGGDWLSGGGYVGLYVYIYTRTMASEYYPTTQQETYDNVTCQTAVLHEFSAGMSAHCAQPDLRHIIWMPCVARLDFHRLRNIKLSSSRECLPLYLLTFYPVFFFILISSVPLSHIFWYILFLPLSISLFTCLAGVCVCIRKLFIHTRRHTHDLRGHGHLIFFFFIHKYRLRESHVGSPCRVSSSRSTCFPLFFVFFGRGMYKRRSYFRRVSPNPPP